MVECDCAPPSGMCGDGPDICPMCGKPVPGASTHVYSSAVSTGIGLDAGMGFGAALDLLKRGRLVARDGWNGKGMYLFLVDGGDGTAAGTRYSVTVSSPELLPIAPIVCMRTAQGTITVGWLPSQADMLAHDWRDVDV